MKNTDKVKGIMPLKCSFCGMEFIPLQGGKCKDCGRLYCAGHLSVSGHKCAHAGKKE